jgi:hypothetical protein
MSKKINVLSLLLLLLGMIACQKTSTLPFEQDAYIWQRQWTPALRDAMQQSSPYIKKWRILVAEVTASGKMKTFPINWAALSLSKKKGVLVVRINGQLTSWNPEKTTHDIAALLKKFAAITPLIAGIEIDHDCATAKLQGYMSFLKKIRALDSLNNKTLSITVLPSWLNSPQLVPLLSLSNTAVLQVHSISDPKKGLINIQDVKKWLQAFDALTPVPFYVALPTYSSVVAWNNNGKIIGIESEVPRSFSRKNSQTIIANPLLVSQLVRALKQTPYQHLKGISWFRLPTKNDRRAWSMATWLAIIKGKKIATQLEGFVINGYSPKAYDIQVMNTGDIDTVLPQTVVVSSTTAHCYAADALRSYQYHQEKGNIVFQRTKQAILKIHQRHIVGWVHCDGQRIVVDVQK